MLQQKNTGSEEMSNARTLGVYTPFKIEGKRNISPSKISSFFTDSGKWYREVIEDEANFTGNFASIYGTVIHYIIEHVNNGNKDKDSIRDEVIDYLERKIEYGSLTTDEGKIIVEFVPTYYEKLKTLVQDTAEQEGMTNYKVYLEKPVGKEIEGTEFSIGGTIDCILEDDNKIVIVDFKSVGAISKSIDKYLAQLRAYAVLVNEVKNPKHKAVKFGVIQIQRRKPLKSGKESTAKFLEPFEGRLLDEQQLKVFHEELRTILGCLKLVKDNPQIKDYIFRDNNYSSF